MRDTNNTHNNPDSSEAFDQELVRVFVVGSRAAVPLMSQNFANIGFAKVSEWSPPFPAHRHRYIPRQRSLNR